VKIVPDSHPFERFIISIFETNLSILWKIIFHGKFYGGIKLQIM